jgi:hypothetical protein
MPTRRDDSRPRMKIVSIRMSEDIWEAVQDEAIRAGVSASEFIREAAIIRMAYRWGTRDGDDEIIARLRALGVMAND